MVVATRRGYDWAGNVQRGARIRVATKYVAIAREHFAAKGMHVDLIKLYGSMELAPLSGLADAIVDLVSTGNTLKANDLVEVENIMPITARLIVNPVALKLKRDVVKPLIDALTARRDGGSRRPDHGRARAPATFDSRRPGLRCRARRAGRVRDRAGPGGRRRGRRDHRRRARARRRGAARLHAPLRPARRDVGRRARNRRGRDARARTSACPTRSARRSRPRPRASARSTRRRRRTAARSPSPRTTARELGQRVTPLDRVGIYVPGGKAAYPSSVLMNAIPAHVAGVREIVMVVPTPDGVRNPLVLAAAHLAGVTRAVHDRRRAGDRRARVRHRDDSRRRQDLRTGQRVRRRGQAPRVRRRRHRHGRGRVGDRRDRRRARRIPTGSRSTSSRRPSTTSSRRRSCSRPTRALIDAVEARDASRTRVDCRARRSSRRRSRSAARSCACATSPKRATLRTGSRPSISSSRSPIPTRCCRASATPARSSSGTTRPRRSATTAPDRTTCCRPDARRAFQLAARRVRFPEAVERAAHFIAAAARTLGPVAATLAPRRGLDRACAVGRSAPGNVRS